MSADKIEKTVILDAPRERVWAAVSEAHRFGAWFGVEFDGPFVEGGWLTGRIEPTQVDPEVAKLQEPVKGLPFTIRVDEIKPMERFSFHWRPFAIDPAHDYSQEPMTLVLFDLSHAPSGVRLTITETGFSQIPAERREQAYQANDWGWAHQCLLIGKYLAQGL